MSTEIKFGDFATTLGELPEKSVVQLVNQAVGHKLGNEVDAKVVGEIRKAINPSNPDREHVTRDDVKAYRAANAEAVSALATKFRSEVWTRICAGTLDESVARGPRVDPLTAMINEIAFELTRAQLKASNLQEPAGATRARTVDGVEVAAKPAQKLEFPNGMAFTMRELVDRRIERDKATITEAAKRRLAEKQRLIDRAAKAVEGAEAGDTLGF